MRRGLKLGIGERGRVQAEPIRRFPDEEGTEIETKSIWTTLLSRLDQKIPR